MLVRSLTIKKLVVLVVVVLFVVSDYHQIFFFFSLLADHDIVVQNKGFLQQHYFEMKTPFKNWENLILSQ